jgi:hypothetical protein
MKLRVLYLTGALIATALPLSARAIPVHPDHHATTTSAQQATSATYTCPPGYYWDRTVMPRTASLGRRIAQCAGE